MTVQPTRADVRIPRHASRSAAKSSSAFATLFVITLTALAILVRYYLRERKLHNAAREDLARSSSPSSALGPARGEMTQSSPMDLSGVLVRLPEKLKLETELLAANTNGSLSVRQSPNSGTSPATTLPAYTSFQSQPSPYARASGAQSHEYERSVSSASMNTLSAATEEVRHSFSSAATRASTSNETETDGASSSYASISSDAQVSLELSRSAPYGLILFTVLSDRDANLSPAEADSGPATRSVSRLALDMCLHPVHPWHHFIPLTSFLQLRRRTVSGRFRYRTVLHSSFLWRLRP